MTKKECLLSAEQCVCNDRQDQYGNAENNFQTIANFWMTYLETKGQEVEIEAHDVAVMMALMKIARIATGKPKEDNWVDLIGYGACGCELQMSK